MGVPWKQKLVVLTILGMGTFIVRTSQLPHCQLALTHVDDRRYPYKGIQLVRRLFDLIHAMGRSRIERGYVCRKPAHDLAFVSRMVWSPSQLRPC